ncbi:MAG: helix-turn-helix domain-containing protein, partial [Clostridia bacterium]|nr:helix-turn-helix domain-containing protein [Clostridia bacterium]
NKNPRLLHVKQAAKIVDIIGRMKELKLAENLKMLRKYKKMSRAELGNLLGVTSTAVSSWENGKREPSLEMLAKICEIFDETFDSILT